MVVQKTKKTPNSAKTASTERAKKETGQAPKESKRPTGQAKIMKAKSKKQEAEKERYFEAVGRRKTSVARVRLFSSDKSASHGKEASSEIEVNGKPYEKYFFTPELAKVATASLRKIKLLSKFRITAKIKGGGIHSQAEAFRHATARALLKFNPEFRKKLKKAGFLTRDPRAKERKKFGLKKARKASQWSKR